MRHGCYCLVHTAGRRARCHVVISLHLLGGSDVVLAMMSFFKDLFHNRAVLGAERKACKICPSAVCRECYSCRKLVCIKKSGLLLKK
jgi:hypothetical protein